MITSTLQPGNLGRDQKKMNWGAALATAVCG
jgi:hypothetical protein